ncbi:hypothetical protein [Leifsonia xyli]|uniref:hypothetical protein n=1 Tax=Leifsonia xyli TaxID=1575 RepID=UPI000AD3F96D
MGRSATTAHGLGFRAVLVRPGEPDTVVSASADHGTAPAALRARALFDGREVWEIFVLDDDTEWPRGATYRLIDLMDDAGNPIGPWLGD